ncbi:MAG: aldehyde reductase [Micropepsaceae bacterium]
MSDLVLVTGGSGFIGVHSIVQLLKAGNRVRATLRTPSREAEVRGIVAAGGAQAGDQLSFAQADLMSDVGWNEAAKGCDYLLHIASPFPPAVPKHEDELIIPAREGTLRALKAAKAAGVKRAVVTSSFAAIGYGRPGNPSKPFHEEDWTDPEGADVRAYVKSKTIAEKAAWDFANREGLELAVVNPVAVLGPVLGKDYSTSIEIVKKLMDGSFPGCPKIGFSIVDVRDVADLHIRAMRHPAAAGQRFLATNEQFCWMSDVAKILKARMGEAARRVPTRTLPNWLVRIVARFDPIVGQIVPELGRVRPATGEKACRTLGWTRHSTEDAIVATADSLIAQGLLKA